MTDQLCNVNGCTRPFRAREMCSTHYERWRMENPEKRARTYALRRKQRRLSTKKNQPSAEQKERRRLNAAAKRKRDKLLGQRARHAVLNAVRHGKMKRPARCQPCGRKPEPASDGRSLIFAHHEDYTKPFKVEWLCNWCHADRHYGEALDVAV
jgi:hypothetical protein